MTTEVPGYRSVGSGTIAGVGSSADFWSGSPHNATNGSYLLFGSDYVRPQISCDRGYGFPLRCIQAFTCTVRTSGLNKSEMQESITAGTSGYRNVGSGAMTDEGGGYYWSASPAGASHGLYLSFSAAFVSPQGSTYRGSGFPLRCIQELALHGPNRGSRQNGGTEEQKSITAGISGYRNVGSGTMAVEGSIGYYWSAPPSGATNGLYLYFGSGFVRPQISCDRGYGFPLRCTKNLPYTIRTG